MGILNDVWNKVEEGWDAVTGAAEDLVDAAEKEIVEAFWEWLTDAELEYLEDGGKDVDTPDTEQYTESGSTSSPLQLVDPTIYAVGTVDDIVTEPDAWWAGIVAGPVGDAEPTSDAVPAPGAGSPGLGDTFNVHEAVIAVSSANALAAPDVALPDLPGTSDVEIVSANILADTMVWTDFNAPDPSVTIVELFDADLPDLYQEPPPVGAYDDDVTPEVEATYSAPHWEGAGSPHDASSTMLSSFLF